MTSFLLRRAAFALGTLAAGACVKAPEGTLGQPVVQGGVAVTVTEATLAHLDLEGPQGAQPTSSPLLLVRLSLANTGASAVRYDLNWGAPASTQAQTALLFVDPGPEGMPTSGVNIPAALLQGVRYLGDPVQEPTTVGPAETIEDVLLFQAPPAGTTALILSLPPAVFGAGAKAPAYVRIPFSAAEPVAPAAVGVGALHEGDGFSFKVDATSIAWVRLSDAAGKAGYADRPVFRVDYTVTNTGSDATEYVGAGSNNAVPSLLQPDGTPVPRASFPGGVTADGLQTGSAAIAPGASFSNFMLFDRPPQGVTDVRLQVPGRRFGRTGLVRVSIPYAFADPAAPDELTTPRVIEPPTPE